MERGYDTINTSVSSSLTQILEMNTNGVDQITVQLKNETGGALTGFSVQGKSAANLGWVDIASSGFASPGLWTLYASADPTTLADGAECLVMLNTNGLEQMRVLASAGTTGNIKCGGGAV